ncbi:hypothetical protein ACPW96_18275 [Micromonospora sp. DT81.3]|uniref:hypothetical protein n=1 Tax=Micromonospora sp. DT81.3 TaxID=3416523 RepID=UPI003CF3C79A
MTTKRTLTALVGFAAGLALLAGCTPSAPTPSPSVTAIESATPTPTATGGAPTSEDEAIAAAEAVLVARNEMFDQVAIDGWTDYERLQEVSIGQAYTDALPGFEALKAEGRTQTGIATLEIIDSVVVPGPNEVEFGTVAIRACFDPSTREQKLADGSPAPLPSPVRSIKESTVAYFPEQDKWLVTDFGDPAGGREEC